MNDFAEAQKFASLYRCAVCWSHLEIDQDNNVFCARYPEDHKDAGYVTANYVERRRGESGSEAIEAKSVLRRVGILPKKSVEKLLDELGFGG
jgi:hypothetical protein